MDLPQGNDLKTIQESNKVKGRLRTFFDQLQNSWLTIITLLVVTIYGFYNQSRIKNIEQRLPVINQNTVNVSTDTSKQGNQPEKEKTKDGATLGINTEFNPEDWIIESLELDKEGYYCSLTNKFDYWSMWSKATYPPALNKIKIKILAKPKPGSKLLPTISISYGEFKPHFSPIQFYRLNIFDTDQKSIRLYNDKNKSVAQTWLKEEPDLSSEMLIILSPRNPDPNSRVLNLNPSFEYALPEKERPINFSPEEKFQVTLPTVGLEDGTVRKQVGIGGSKQTCFKPIAVEIK